MTTEIRAASSDQIRNANISIIDEETGEEVYSDEEVTVPVGGTETVTFSDTTSSENTNTYTVKVNYDTGELENLSAEGTLTGRIELGSSSDDTQNVDDGGDTNDGSAVSVSGDSITALATTSTFGNSTADSGPICIGPDCGETSGSETDNVSLSGDVMKGTLFVDNITDESTTCFGELCDIETGSATGDLGVDSNTMNGTLNVTELKPDSAQQICAGTEC